MIGGWRGEEWFATYGLGRERVGVILLKVIKGRLSVRIHFGGICEGVEAQARSRKGLRKLVRVPLRRTERARKRGLGECMNGRRLVVGNIKPQGVRARPAPDSEGFGGVDVLLYLEKQRQQPLWWGGLLSPLLMMMDVVAGKRWSIALGVGLVVARAQRTMFVLPGSETALKTRSYRRPVK